MEFLRDFWPVGLLSLGVLALLGVAIYSTVRESEDFARFASAHHCRVVGRVRGNALVSPTIDSKGNVGVAITQIPDKIGYYCDDGVTYWR
jgi:hypothetical protein